MNNKILLKTWDKLCQEKNICDDIIRICSIRNNTENYTKYILDDDGSFFSKFVANLSIIDSEKYEYYKEFYNSDAVVYIKKEDCLLKSPSNKKELKGIFPFHLRLIFEHENSISTSWQEVLRFTLLKSEYKMLVTYPNTKHQCDKYIEIYSNVLLSSNYDGQMLIIFCYIDCDKKLIENFGYEWKNRKLNKISLSI